MNQTPGMFEVVVPTEDGYDNLPKPAPLYRVLAQEGEYIHRKTRIGSVMLRQPIPRKELARIGYADGVFNWEVTPIPAEIFSQAHDFFKRIYDKHKTEAEVLITMHQERDEYRLFVPFQRVSYAGVKSIHEPNHIAKDWQIVGTLHSHCNFGAFHSGTDKGDASDMDGVHFTIGKVDQEKPEIVAMVAMGGKEFHYANTTLIADVAFGKATAPEWWDQYVYPGAVPDEKPKGFSSLDDIEWAKFKGTHVGPKQVQKWEPQTSHFPKAGSGQPIPQIPYQSTYKSEPWGDYRTWQENRDRDHRSDDIYTVLAESEEFNRRQNRRFNKAKKRGTGQRQYNWGNNKQTQVSTGIPELDQVNNIIEMAEEMGLFSDEDYVRVAASDMDELAFWKNFFVGRQANLAEVLDACGLKIQYKITQKGANG